MDESCEDRGGLIPGRDRLSMCRQVFEMQLDRLAGMDGSFFDGRSV